MQIGDFTSEKAFNGFAMGFVHWELRNAYHKNNI